MGKLNQWHCIDCKSYFQNKEALIRHFLIHHKTKKLWYNSKFCKIQETFNPSRRDCFDLNFKEFNSPGNRLDEKNVGIIYGS
jgi:hypothetical protein